MLLFLGGVLIFKAKIELDKGTTTSRGGERKQSESPLLFRINNAKTFFLGGEFIVIALVPYRGKDK